MNIYTTRMAVDAPEKTMVPLGEHLEVRDQVIRAELQILGGKLDSAVVDLQRGLGDLDTDLKRRPETEAVSKAIRTNLAWFGAILLSILAIFWAAFDTGGAVTSSFADEVLGAKEAHMVQARQIQAMDLKYEQIDGKLDTLIHAASTNGSAQVNGTATINPKGE